MTKKGKVQFGDLMLLAVYGDFRKCFVSLKFSGKFLNVAVAKEETTYSYVPNKLGCLYKR